MKSQRWCSLNGIVLGHHISSSGIRVDPAKIHIIKQIKIPSSQKEVSIFLGHAGYYRIFIPSFTRLATPLFKLLSKESEFNWNDECQVSFEILKKRYPCFKRTKLVHSFSYLYRCLRHIPWGSPWANRKSNALCYLLHQ